MSDENYPACIICVNGKHDACDGWCNDEMECSCEDDYHKRQIYKPLSGMTAKKRRRRDRKNNGLPEDKAAEVLAEAAFGDISQSEAGGKLGVQQQAISGRIARALSVRPPKELRTAKDLIQQQQSDRAEAIRTKIEEVHDRFQETIMSIPAVELKKILISNPSAILSAWSNTAKLQTKIDIEEAKKDTREAAKSIFRLRTKEDWEMLFFDMARQENDGFVPGFYDVARKLMIKTGRLKEDIIVAEEQK